MNKRLRLFVVAIAALALIVGAIVATGVSNTRAKQEMDARLQALKSAAAAGAAGRAACANVVTRVEQELRALEADEGGSKRVVNGYRALGDCQMQLGQSRQAIEAYQKVVSFEPEAGRAHGDLARAYSRSGDHTNAVRHARLAAQLSPTQWQAYRVLARVLEAAAQYDDALTAMRKAASLAPANQQKGAQSAIARLEARASGSASAADPTDDDDE